MEMPLNLVVISLGDDRAFLLKNKAFGATFWRGNKSLIHKSPVGKITPPPHPLHTPKRDKARLHCVRVIKNPQPRESFTQQKCLVLHVQCIL